MVYEIIQEEVGKIGTECTLYRACTKIVGVYGGTVFVGKRLVAFWCSYHRKVKAGFGAYESERAEIGQDVGLFS